MILVVAKKNPRQEKELRHILNNGFLYNGVHYSRFGKSASQAKEGITAFVCDAVFDELYQITQMDLPVKECVISKYESQRCLLFSSCTLISGYMPNIVIIGEYEKTLPNQLIKFVVEKEKEFTDKAAGQKKSYLSKEIEEGYQDIRLSPFDGCGCHEQEFMEKVSSQLGLCYHAAGAQVRLPFIKGYSVYVPFRKILKEWGCESVTDIYGATHPIDTIDCIWNTSMFKGHKIFREAYGNEAWKNYLQTLKKYHFKLGISKYSHHVSQINKYTRMNFQYLQCLDLWNPKYIAHFRQSKPDGYDILDEKNDGKIIQLARYTTRLFEKIIQGEPFYTCKFMGITDTDEYEPESKYLEAALINHVMLKDPAIKQFIYRKLKKAIEEAKVGKIYCSGFYHTGVGDMIGYLQYAAGQTPAGCLKAGELYSGNFAPGTLLSFRSPLVDPSEVNRINLVQNDLTRKWLGHFKDQDIVMFNLYDASLPQQGGADCDGDIFLLTNDPVLTASKIEKPIILDIEDKLTVSPKPYTKDNLTEYELMTRDSRIGEITNAATSIANKYTANEEVKKKYSDFTSLLRIFQGKEIDFLKTGFRWHMSNSLRKHLDQLPYFLLYNYPAKRKKYQTIMEKNKQLKEGEEKLTPNAYHSPSPVNELCDYICTWEKKHILWNREINCLEESRNLVLNKELALTDQTALRICRKTINQYAALLKEQLTKEGSPKDRSCALDAVMETCKEQLKTALNIEEEQIANYVISASYSSLSISKAFAWSAYGDYIIKNLKTNSDPQKHISIKEVPSKTDASYEYLGKYYEFKAGGTHLSM